MAQTILRLPVVIHRTGVSPAQPLPPYQPSIIPPAGKALGKRSVGWPASDIEAINAARIAGQNDNSDSRPGSPAGIRP